MGGAVYSGLQDHGSLDMVERTGVYLGNLPVRHLCCLFSVLWIRLTR